MNSGSKPIPEPKVILLLVSHISREMISSSADRGAFRNTLTRLLNFGVAVALENVGPEPVFSDLFAEFQLPFRQVVEEKLVLVGEKLNKKLSSSPAPDSLVNLIETIKISDDMLIVNSFLLAEDTELISLSDVVISPLTGLVQENRWETTFFQSCKPPLAGWQQWGEKVLKGIEFQSSAWHRNKSFVKKK